MSKAKDFYSKSVPEAIRQACDDFATSQEKLDIEVLETGSKGIFGLCKKRAHIRVNLKKKDSSEEIEKQKDTASNRKKTGKATQKQEKDISAGQTKAPAEEKSKAAQPVTESNSSGMKGKTSEKEQLVPPSEEILASVKMTWNKYWF